MEAMSCCSSGEEQVTLCEPLQYLRNQHDSLLKKLDRIFISAAIISTESGSADWQEKLDDLRKKVDSFVEELDPHSKKEDDVLFPMLAKYVSRESDPLAAMERDHEVGYKCLDLYFEAIEKANSPINADEAKEIAGYALQVNSIFGCHFMSEQSTLFPLAEKSFSAEEKELLAQRFAEIGPE